MCLSRYSQKCTLGPNEVVRGCVRKFLTEKLITERTHVSVFRLNLLTFDQVISFDLRWSQPFSTSTSQPPAWLSSMSGSESPNMISWKWFHSEHWHDALSSQETWIDQIVEIWIDKIVALVSCPLLSSCQAWDPLYIDTDRICLQIQTLLCHKTLQNHFVWAEISPTVSFILWL